MKQALGLVLVFVAGCGVLVIFCWSCIRAGKDSESGDL